ncbi:substrate-binding periplasmic protein [Massilia sp. TSP1-1-2]|uniref:substrate-binding periplasmic protein n=1 Tax=Massilia sp. TSP1-1-2 TaxID=2804649 RepID=UPI003CF383B3
MKRTTRRLAILSLACLCAAGAAARPRLHITTESSPPSAMMGQSMVIGFATEKVRRIMERVGIDYEIEMLPWKRAYLLAQTKTNTCVYSTTRVPEREALFKWIGPTHANDWTLFGRADRRYRIASIEDARAYRIGAYNGDVRSEALIAQGFIVHTVQDKLANPRKLLVNRIDLWASSMRVGSAIVAENGWGGQIVPVLTFRRTELYLACNPGLPDALVRKMNTALRAMNSEGVSAVIEKKYHYAGTGVQR